MLVNPKGPLRLFRWNLAYKNTAQETGGGRRLNGAFMVLLWEKLRIELGLVDLSRISSGTFFREVHPGSGMASQNDQNKAKRERKLSNHDES